MYHPRQNDPVNPTAYCFSTTGAALSTLGALPFLDAAAFLAFGTLDAAATLFFFNFGAEVFAFFGAAVFFEVAVLTFLDAVAFATVDFFTFGAAPAVAAFFTGAYSNGDETIQ